MTPCYYCEADDDACKTCIHSDTYIDPQEEITRLREQVAAQAAVIESLKYALHEARFNMPADKRGAACHKVILDALSIPTDSTTAPLEIEL